MKKFLHIVRRFYLYCVVFVLRVSRVMLRTKTRHWP